jgi:putative transposase
MEQRAYPTDLTDEQWNAIAELFPDTTRSDGRTGRTRRYSYRAILNGILYITRAGCAWSLMPHDLPPPATCYHYFRKWSRNGLFDRLLTDLRQRDRKQAGRDPMPTAGLLDSQSVKTTEKGGSPEPMTSAMTATKRSKGASVTCS